MKKIISNTLFTIYIIVAVFVTICLLSYNNYKITEFGDYSLVLITNDDVEPDFQDGDLVITKKSKYIGENEKVFFYNTFEREIEVSLGTITDSQKITQSETTYTLEGGNKISSAYVLGPASEATVIPKAGAVLSVLESKWGFLFIIVFPALIAFLYQISVIFSQIKEAREESKSEEKNEKMQKETVKQEEKKAEEDTAEVKKAEEEKVNE